MHDDGRAGPKSPLTPPLARAYFHVGLATAQCPTDFAVQLPPPHAHAHTPPHHCAYAPSPGVHCTPLAHAADRWRSVCTITDAPAQSRLQLRAARKYTPFPVSRPSLRDSARALKIDFHLAPLAHGCYTFRAVLVYLLHTRPNRLRYPSMKPNVHTMTARWL